MIEINCDVGEGMNNEEELFPFISSCSVACGGHAGDEESMKRVVRLAKQYDVAIGAHPSYPDAANFGRVSMTMEKDDLIKSIQRQITALLNICQEEGVKMHHIKAHGALYNDCSRNENIARIYLEAITPFKSGRFIFVQDGSRIAELAEEGSFHLYYEGFADRSYEFDLSLTPRAEMFSVISDTDEILRRVAEMETGKIQTVAGLREIRVDTFCIHSDTPAAIEIVKALHSAHNLTYKRLGEEGIIIEWPAHLQQKHLYNRIAFFKVLQQNFAEHEIVQTVNSIVILGLKPKEIGELKRLQRQLSAQKTSFTRYKIPVCYHDEYGIDLGILAREKSLSKAEIIDLHTSTCYPVYSIGFLPGFPYLGGLDKQLHAPRLAEPRLSIPAGSVGIGGMQTGIYPQESPGGWRILGRTPIRLFDVAKERPNLLEAGDEIQFYSISKAAFERFSETDFKLEMEVFYA